MSHEGLIHSLWGCMATLWKGPVYIPKCSALKCCIFLAHAIIVTGQEAGHVYSLNRPSALQSFSQLMGTRVHTQVLLPWSVSNSRAFC